MSPDLLEKDIELAALDLFESMGWTWANLFEEQLGEDSLLGRDNQSEVVLPKKLKAALKKLNPDIPQLALSEAYEELTRDRSTLSLVKANREVHRLITGGVKVNILQDDGSTETATVKVIDWNNPSNNDFFVGQQFWIQGEIYKRRTDLIGFINGLPLVFIELKGIYKNVKTAYDNNLRDYLKVIPQLFWYNAVVILSNGLSSRVGSVTAGWDHFKEWKRIEREREEPTVSLETVLRGVCDQARILDIAENFTVFSEVRSDTVKIVGQNHQFLGVNNAMQAVDAIKDNHGKLGVFWHTQGSGKSFSMVFFSQKILRKVPGNWTFVVITDRVSLDDQIYKTFVGCGAVKAPKGGKGKNATRGAQAVDGEHLKQLLTEDHRYVFTLIQKFRTDEIGQQYPELSNRSNIIVMVDEAHRSQYDRFAENLRHALPNAAFIGFTGTPLLAGDTGMTRQTFGEYVSIYNFRQAIEDNATVRLFYENRVPELQLSNDDFSNDLADIIDQADLDEDQTKKVDQEFARQYHLITREERLETIAADIVDHYLGLGNRGKAMVVSIDKITAARMHHKVQSSWQKRLGQLKQELQSFGPATAEQKFALEERIRFMEETDMALVVSQGQNEGEDFQKKGIDILPHRKRMMNENLDVKFKDDKDQLRMVFVCAMWLTGFDVPSCSVIYMDKPMRNHSLMQAIARANRVYPGKENGLIVDYVNVFGNLQKALADYGSDSGGGVELGDSPVQPKQVQLDQLAETILEAKAFCLDRKIVIEDMHVGSRLERLNKLNAAREILIYPDDIRRQFLILADTVKRIYHAIGLDRQRDQFTADRGCLVTLSVAIRAELSTVDISDVMGEVEKLLDSSIAPKGYVIRELRPSFVREDGSAYEESHRIDLSKIDFEALADYFKQGKNKRTGIEMLKGSLSKAVKQMVDLNPTRVELLEKFEKMIAEYNAGTHNADEFFDRLANFAKSLATEDKRAISEGLTEEELAVFDLLTKPSPELTKAQRISLKNMSQTLLEKLKAEKLVIDWRKFARRRASVRHCIHEVLEDLPKAFDDDLYEHKCQKVFDHVFESYYGEGKSKYEGAVA